MSLTQQQIIPLIVKVLNIQEEDIVQVGAGTYSYVFAISDTQIIKVYHSEKSFREKYIDDVDYYEAAEFRESFFNNYLDHKNLLKYDIIQYHNELGLYKIARRLIGSIDKDQFCKVINEKLFFRLLEDMVSALSHLHSHGIIHSDIKPQNILFGNDDVSEFYFKLCDFNISQFCSVVSHDVFSVFATPNYSDQSEKRSIMTDIFMLGTTLLSVILMKYGISISGSQINMSVLTRYKDKVISTTSKVCYDIIAMMILPQKQRTYLSILQKFIDRHNLPDNHPDKNIEITVNHSDQRFEENNREMQELCHERIKTHISSLDPQQLIKFKRLHGITDPSGESPITAAKNPLKVKLDNPSDDSKKESEAKNEYVKLCRQIRDIFTNQFNVQEPVAYFFAQSVCYYPNDECVEDWVKKKTTPDKPLSTKDINALALKLCMSGPYINCHLLLCNFCRIECNQYTALDKMTTELSKSVIETVDMMSCRMDESTPLQCENVEKIVFDVQDEQEATDMVSTIQERKYQMESDREIEPERKRLDASLSTSVSPGNTIVKKYPNGKISKKYYKKVAVPKRDRIVSDDVSDVEKYVKNGKYLNSTRLNKFIRKT